MKVKQVKNIGVIGGKGVCGTFFRNFFEEQGYKVRWSDIGKYPHNDPHDDNLKIVRSSDVVVFAVRPMWRIGEIMRSMSSHIPKDRAPLWINIASYQQWGDELADSRYSRYSLLCIHHQCRPPETGTLRGKKLLVTQRPIPPQPEAAFWNGWIDGFLKTTEATVIDLGSSGEHDELMVMEKMLVHTLSSVMANIIHESGISVEKLLEISSPFFQFAFTMMCRHISNGELAAELVKGPPGKGFKRLSDKIQKSLDFMRIDCSYRDGRWLKSLPALIGKRRMDEATFCFNKFVEVVEKSGVFGPVKQL